MANVYAVSAGNWSTPARWNTGSLPTSADDVYANGFAVTIDQDITVVSIQTRSNTGIAAGGSFTASTSRTINANVLSGTSACLVLSGTSLTFNVNSTNILGSNTSTGSISAISSTPTTSTINITATNITGASGSTATTAHGVNCAGNGNTYVINSTNITGGTSSGNSNTGITFGMSAGTNNVTVISTSITGGSSGSNQFGINFANTSAATYNVSGNVYASTTSYGVNINTTATTTINLTGNVTGASGGSSAYAIIFGGTLCTFNVIGNIVAGSGGAQSHGIYHNSSNGILNITGDVTGGAGGIGVQNGVAGTTNINGTVTGSSSNYGATNTSNGILRVKTAVASTSFPAINGQSTSGITTFEQAVFASNGYSPFAGYCKLKAGSNNYITCQKESGTLTLIDTANASAGYPSASDVRLGTSYNFGNTTGTLAVPLASQVSSGIAVDNTTGTAVITSANVKTAVWDASASSLTTSGSIGERAKNLATTQDVGNLITSLI